MFAVYESLIWPLSYNSTDVKPVSVAKELGTNMDAMKVFMLWLVDWLVDLAWFGLVLIFNKTWLQVGEKLKNSWAKNELFWISFTKFTLFVIHLHGWITELIQLILKYSFLYDLLISKQIENTYINIHIN